MTWNIVSHSASVGSVFNYTEQGESLGRATELIRNRGIREREREAKV